MSFFERNNMPILFFLFDQSCCSHKDDNVISYSDPASGQNQVTTTAAPATAMPTALQPGSITSPPVGMCSSRKHFSVVRMSDRPVTEKYTADQGA